MHTHAHVHRIYQEEMANMNTDAEKPHALALTSWRHRKAHGVMQSVYEGLKTREARDKSHRCSGLEKKRFQFSKSKVKTPLPNIRSLRN